MMMNQEPTPKQQASEAIRAAETILVTTGQHPTGDQAASVVALAMVLRKLGKKVTAVISDSIPTPVGFLSNGSLDRDLDGLRDFIVKIDLSRAEVDKLKYTIEEGKLNIHVTPFKGKFTPSDVTYAHGDFHYDLAVVLGVATRSRIDRVISTKLFETVPVVNIDFHRSNENYGAINMIEPNAASLSEILVALAESLQNGIIDEQIATAMLTGIMASTDRFTATHTTPKALTVAAQLMAAGANQQQIVRNLYRGGRDTRETRRPTQPQEARVETKPASPAPRPVVKTEAEQPKPAETSETSVARPAQTRSEPPLASTQSQSSHPEPAAQTKPKPEAQPETKSEPKPESAGPTTPAPVMTPFGNPLETESKSNPQPANPGPEKSEQSDKTRPQYSSLYTQ